MSLDNRSIQEDVWYLKPIQFGQRSVKIITQNFNGPCSLIAICNILVLRGDIEILPPERTVVSYEFLSQLIADYLLKNPNIDDIGAALSFLPSTTKGMDLNPLFTGATAFRPAGDGGELKLFEQASIELVHGWIVDPDSPEAPVLARTQDYDTSVNLIVEADYATQGMLVPQEQGGEETIVVASGSDNLATAPSDTLRPEMRQKIEDAFIIRSFLESTQQQLTYHGLFHLSSTLAPGTLAALFRLSHVSVLYKSPTDGALYTLVTDVAFLNEHSVVWERLDDIDGASTFVDGEFANSAPAGGDFAGLTPEAVAAAAAERENLQRRNDVDATQGGPGRQPPPPDAQLREKQPDRLPPRYPRGSSGYGEQAGKKKSKDCVIM